MSLLMAIIAIKVQRVFWNDVLKYFVYNEYLALAT